ncbi:MAG: type III-B CRISPR module RAMP protein Cmr1 [bacterium]
MAFCINRFSMIEQQAYEVEVVTPMFLGAADPKETELRAASIKGMLRFWWRATCGIDKLKEMKTKENDIFGSTDTKSSFSISVKTKDNCDEKIKTEFNEYKNKRSAYSKYSVEGHSNLNPYILDYLSYGTYEYKKGQADPIAYNKKHIVPEFKFSIIFNFYNKEYIAEIIKSFKYLLTFGGIGAKNRNGFGSIYSDKIEYINAKNLSNSNLKSFSALSKESKCYEFSEEFNSWEEALCKIGSAYRTARLSIEPKHSYDKRQLISAPLQIRNSNKSELVRHSKPFFLKVQKIKSNGQYKYKGLILFVPYLYLYGKNGNDIAKFNKYKEACNELYDNLK